MDSVGFIGAGNMGFAIMNGIAGSELSDSIKLFAYDSDSAKLGRLADIGVESCTSEADIFDKCGYVFLAVKPQQLEEVLGSVSGAVRSESVIVSICAGITDEYIASKTVSGAKVVLAMPNTPLLLGEGATALSRSESVSDLEFDFVCSIFASCGKCAVIPKDKMKEIIAVNGSSPAFIYLYAKAFIDNAVESGIEPDVATRLFAQSLIGSAKMITDSGRSIEELIEMVSSKGGTTIAGLEKLREGKLEETVASCFDACTKRAYELSK